MKERKFNGEEEKQLKETAMERKVRMRNRARKMTEQKQETEEKSLLAPSVEVEQRLRPALMGAFGEEN